MYPHLGGVARNLTAALLLIPLLLLLAACSRQRRITADDLRSDLTSAISFAAETEIFIDFVRQGRSTDNYADGHLQYLSDELNRSASELHESTPEAAIAEKAQECRTLLDSLALQVAAVGPILGDPGALSDVRQQIAKTRAALEQAKSSL